VEGNRLPEDPIPGTQRLLDEHQGQTPRQDLSWRFGKIILSFFKSQLL